VRTVRVVRVEFDSSRQIRETETELIVPTIFTRESILPFGDGRGYRPAAELEAAAWTLEGAWIVAYAHIDTVFVTNPADIRGQAKDVRFDSKINGIVGDSHYFKAVCDQAFLEGVKKGNLKDVSVAYFCEDNFTPGKFGDEPYDFMQQNFMFGHIAAGVPEGRCPSPFCGMAVDSLLVKPHKDPEETENFIHIPVRDKDLFVDGSERTITLSADEGIEAVVGKLKSDPEGKTHIQKYMFAKAKDWTMEKAQAWVKAHRQDVYNPETYLGKDSVLPSTSRGSDEMSPEEIDAKIAELQRQRDEVQKQLDEVYAKYRKQDLKLQNKIASMQEALQKQINALYAEVPNAGDNPKVKELWNKLENINGEIAAFRGAKVKAEIGNGVASQDASDVRSNQLGLGPCEVLARSRRLLSSR